MATNQEEMNGAAIGQSGPSGHIKAWLLATFVAGALDITAAIVTWLLRDVPPARVLQSVASGVLGRDAYQGGNRAAALGLLLHFVVMAGIVSVYSIASQRVTMLRERRFISGITYGVLVWVAMTYVVVPLSASPVRLPQGFDFDVVLGVLTHIVCVGLPIAFLATRRRGL
jgi:hypothetical protein